MQKNFDKWNQVKKLTNDKPETFGVHEREIWWISFGVNVGVEIDGKNDYFDRPALVLRKFNRQMVWVLPTTQQAKDERFYEKFTFGGNVFYVALTQIRTISTKRFLRKIGMMPKKDFANIKARVVGFIQKDEESPLGESSPGPEP